VRIRCKRIDGAGIGVLDLSSAACMIGIRGRGQGPACHAGTVLPERECGRSPAGGGLL